MYIVVYNFWDMEDESKHVYNVGDEFPFDGRNISKKRIEELSSSKNKIGKVLIKLVKNDNGNPDDSNKKGANDNSDDSNKNNEKPKDLDNKNDNGNPDDSNKK